VSAAIAGAYGVRLPELPSGRWLAVTAAGHWPALRWRSEPGAGLPELAPGSPPPTLRVGEDITHEELVHPLLGRIGAQLALRRGHDAMHAGAVVGAGGAWAVIGAKGAGKSTLLAAFARAGSPVVTDDVLVFGQGVAMAGPRCIDLRPDAQWVGPSTNVRPSDPRRRIALAPIAGEHPLAGLIHLDWSENAPAVEGLTRGEAVRRLLAVQNEKGFPARPESVLDLAALPNVRLTRPRSWPALGDAVAVARAVVGAGQPAPPAVARERVLSKCA
jgi:hypothetical protein